MTTTYYRADKIFTGEDEDTFVTAFGVEDGTFTFVGDAAGIPEGGPRSWTCPPPCCPACSTCTRTPPTWPCW